MLASPLLLTSNNGGRWLGVSPTTRSVAMKVRIRKTPVEREIDGVKLDRLAPGAVRDMSSSLATWLIVEGYAEPEMRRSPGADDVQRFSGSEERSVAKDRRRQDS